MKKYYLTILLFTLFSSSNIQAATVSCSFMTVEAYELTSCAWVGTAGYEDIWDIFGDGISLTMENSLLSNLDAQQIFRAGETEKGTVYLIGGDMGVEGRLSSIEDGLLIVYSGFCNVGFG